MALLELRNVCKGYGQEGHQAPVLHDINLTVDEGDFVTIIGYSGTGKTTLMALLAGLIKPDAGEVLMNGQAVTGPDHERGLVFQNYSLLPWLTVAGNIRLGVDERFPGWSRSERARQVEKYVAMVKLPAAAGKLPAELSGGMRQRVAVARGLAMEPKVLLLDEPLSALDALTRAQLQDEISEIRRSTGTTVIWVTNDPDEALLMADRVIPLLPGHGSGATLAAAMAIGVPRPRDRMTVGRNQQFQVLRRTLITTLIEAKRKRPTLSRSVVLPDILPEDLMTMDTVRSLNRRGPRRRSDLVKETVEVVS